MSRPSGFDDQPQLLDVAEHGDALDDPEFRAMLGLDEPTELPPR